MATDTAATASPDRRVRRQAQAQQHADQGGKGGMAAILIALGLGGLAAYELTRAKCPTGYTYVNGQCVQNTTVSPPPITNPPGGLVPPAGFPTQWCTMTADEQACCMVWYDLLNQWNTAPGDDVNGTGILGAYQGNRPDLGPGGVSTAAKYIVEAPQGPPNQFEDTVYSLIANPPAGAPSDFSGSNAIIEATIYLILGRWFAPPHGSNWALYTSQANNIPLLAANFYNSAEFQARVPAQVAAAVCTQ